MTEGVGPVKGPQLDRLDRGSGRGAEAEEQGRDVVPVGAPPSKL